MPLAHPERFRYPPTVIGEVAERSKAAVLKTVGPDGPVGSNPTLSARLLRSEGPQPLLP